MQGARAPHFFNASYIPEQLLNSYNGIKIRLWSISSLYGGYVSRLSNSNNRCLSNEADIRIPVSKKQIGNAVFEIEG